MSELLSCPFCGGPAQIVIGSPGRHYVRCEGCGASGDDRSREKAIAIWNRRADANAITERDRRIEEWQEPPLTCPHIDAAISSDELSDEAKAELAEIRDINSQLRYGTWAMRAQLTASRAECEGLRAARKESEKRAIGNGMAIAAAIVMRVWGESTMAGEILGAAGYKTEADLIADGVDEYDIEPLRAALSQKETGA